MALLMYGFILFLTVGINGLSKGESYITYENDRYYTPDVEKEAATYNSFHRAVYLFFFRLGMRKEITRREKSRRNLGIKDKINDIIWEEKNRHAK